MRAPYNPLAALNSADDWRRREWREFTDYLVLTPEGVFSVRQEGSTVFKRPARAEDFERIFGEVVKERLFRGAIELRNRVPYQLLLQAISFFRYVWEQQQREDVLLLYFYEESQQYVLVHPPLNWASKIRVRYELPVTPEEAVRFGSIHSHGAERAYHSLEDEKDDLCSPGIHVIVGNLDRSYQSVKCVASDSRHCFDVPLWDVFTEPIAPTFPASWFAPLPSTKRSTAYDPRL